MRDKVAMVLHYGFSHLGVKIVVVAAAFFYGLVSVVGAGVLGRDVIAPTKQKVYCSTAPVATSDTDAIGNTIYTCDQMIRTFNFDK